MAFKVNFAVYGALADGNENKCQAIDVTQKLQQRLDEHDGVVTINNKAMGRDPSPGYTKHFGANVTVGGEGKWFACQEGQTIDFSHSKTPHR